MALAGKNISRFYFIVFQAVMYFHFHFALQKFGIAGAAHAVFAVEEQFQPFMYCGIHREPFSRAGSINARRLLSILG
jgi:hypothetical protein